MNKWGNWRKWGIGMGLMAFLLSFLGICVGLWSGLNTGHTCLLNVGYTIHHPIPTFVVMAGATFLIVWSSIILLTVAESDPFYLPTMAIKRSQLWAVEAYNGEACFAYQKVVHSYWIVWAFVYITPLSYWSNCCLAYYQNPTLIPLTIAANVLMGQACIGGAIVTDEKMYSRWIRLWMMVSPFRFISYKHDPVTGMTREEAKAVMPVTECAAWYEYWEHRLRAKEWADKTERDRFGMVRVWMKETNEATTTAWEQERLEEECQQITSKYHHPHGEDGCQLRPVTISDPPGDHMDRANATEEVQERMKTSKTPLKIRRKLENRDEERVRISVVHGSG